MVVPSMPLRGGYINGHPIRIRIDLRRRSRARIDPIYLGEEDCAQGGQIHLRYLPCSCREPFQVRLLPFPSPICVDAGCWGFYFFYNELIWLSLSPRI